MSDVLKAVLSKVYGVTDETKVAEFLAKSDEDQIAEITTMDAARVTKFKGESTTAFNKGHQTAKAEVLNEFEAALRTKYAISDEAIKGESLIEAIVQQTATKAGKSKLTDEEVKAHPLYLSLQADGKAAVTEANKAWEKKYNDREADLTRQSHVADLKKRGLEQLADLKPVLPQTEAIANKYREMFAKGFEDITEETLENGTKLLRDKEGKPIQDAHGNNISFADYTKTLAGTYFEFAASSDRGSAGNNNNGGGGNGNNGGVKKPTNLEELAKIINDPNTPLDVKAQVSKEYTETYG